VSPRGLFPSVGAPLIAGVVLQGAGQADVLLRGVGPTLARFGVTDCSGQTAIRLMQGTSSVREGRRIAGAENAAEIRRLETALGAFRLPDDGFDSVASDALAAGS